MTTRAGRNFSTINWRLLYGVARKAGLNEAEAQDAVQDCVITMSRQMPKFRYEPERCSFKGWLLMILRQRVGRQFQKRMQSGAAGDSDACYIALGDEATETNTVSHLPDASGDQLDSIWEAEWKQHILALAAERVKRGVSDAQFQIFDLHVLHGWPVRDVAQTLGSASRKFISQSYAWAGDADAKWSR